ncbi:MAG: OmpA family protein [Phycisphaerales bacterium]
MRSRGVTQRLASGVQNQKERRMLTGVHRLVVVGLGLILSALTLQGCVGQGEYDNLYETNAALKNSLAETERQRDEARSSLDQLRSRMGSGEGALSALERQNAELKRQLDQALADYRGLQDRFGNLKFGPVDAETDAALKELASRYPGLLAYDSARGMLRFASDLTFDSGSDVVKPDAARALQALAEILNNSAATGYDVVIEGHTDTQRISDNTSKRHPTNRHLSVHRSISVINEMTKMGVDASRLMAAGWGEFRPAVQNSPSGNTPQNRRVEIFFAKSAGDSIPVGAAPAATPTTGRGTPDAGGVPTRQPDITK